MEFHGNTRVVLVGVVVFERLEPKRRTYRPAALLVAAGVLKKSALPCLHLGIRVRTGDRRRAVRRVGQVWCGEVRLARLVAGWLVGLVRRVAATAPIATADTEYYGIRVASQYRGGSYFLSSLIGQLGAGDQARQQNHTTRPER